MKMKKVFQTDQQEVNIFTSFKEQPPFCQPTSKAEGNCKIAVLSKIGETQRILWRSKASFQCHSEEFSRNTDALLQRNTTESCLSNGVLAARFTVSGRILE